MSSKKMIINYLVSGAKERNDTRRYHIAAERRWNAKKEIPKKNAALNSSLSLLELSVSSCRGSTLCNREARTLPTTVVHMRRLIDDDNDSGERKKDFCEKGKLCSCTRCNFIQFKHFDCDLCDLCEAMMTFLSLSFRYFCCVVNVCARATCDFSLHSTWRRNFISTSGISGRN